MAPKMFAYRQEPSGNVVAVAATDKFAAAEALCNTYPDSIADEFMLIAEGTGEFIELILGEFGGVAVVLDTLEVQ